MSTLSAEHKVAALAHLNEICPDTFDEGEFGPWTFTDLARNGDEWKLTFNNADADGGSVGFQYAGECVVEDGIDADWFEQINAAIIEWEDGRA